MPPSLDSGALRAAVALAQAPRIGCQKYRELVERHGSAATAFTAVIPPRARDAALVEADAILARAARCGAHALVFGEAMYPERFHDLALPPSVCYALGRLELLAMPAVAIVGTRTSSESGERFTHRLAGALARKGVVIVSGMARGIDAAAHRGALDAGGGTIAVLACGCDRPYPPSHRALHRRICEAGLVVSEAPPGAAQLPRGGFLRRNRMIAALGQAVIVIEAGGHSGALKTAEMAADIGRKVGAVPGGIDSPRSVGTNRLIRNGADLIADLEDAMTLVSRTTGAFQMPQRPSGTEDSGEPSGVEADCGDSLDPSAQALLNALATGASTFDELAWRTGLPPRDLGVAITTLEMMGAIWSDHHGAVRLAR